MKTNTIREIFYGVIILLVTCGLLSASTRPTKPRVISNNEPATIDHEIGDIYRAMARLPLVQTANVTIYDRTTDTATAVFPEPFDDTTYVVTMGFTFGTVYQQHRITKIDNRSALVTVVVNVPGDSVKIGLHAVGKRP